MFCQHFFCVKFFMMKKTSGKFLHDETGAVYYNGRRVRGVYDQVADQVAAVASGCYIFNDENFKF